MLFNEERWDGAVRQVDSIVELLDLQPGSKVLDLCCGPGRHALEFARRGFEVAGVDRTLEYLDEAKKRSADEGLSATFVQSDMREYVKTDAYDVAVNLFTSFGIFDDIEDDRRVLRNMHSSLKPGGSFIIDTIGKELVARDFKSRDWHRESDGTIVTEERTVLDSWSRLASKWTVLRAGEQREFEFSLRCYSAVELSSLFSEAGFKKTSCYGGLSGIPYDHEAKRLVIVGKK
jgi:SAM-dependent methyltransferase